MEGREGKGREGHSEPGELRGKGREAAGQMKHGACDAQVQPGFCSVLRRKRQWKVSKAHSAVCSVHDCPLSPTAVPAT